MREQAVILINAYTQSEAELYQPRRICEALRRRGIDARIERNLYFTERYRGDADFIVYLDKDRYCARQLEARGVRLFNRAAAIEACDDKMLTYLALEGAVPMPETIAGPLCYTPEAPLQGLEAVERLGYPLVVKECFGSQGKGVFLAKDREELVALAGRVKCRPHLFQKFIAESYGRDVRVLVLGGRVIGAMQRSAHGDFRSNAALGGSGARFVPDEACTKLCLTAAERLGLDYCGVDLLFGRDGFLLCEVNSNAFFAAFERATGTDVADLYAAYMIRTIYGGFYDRDQNA